MLLVSIGPVLALLPPPFCASDYAQGPYMDLNPKVIFSYGHYSHLGILAILEGPFGQRTRRGRCPIEQRGEFSVRPNERPSARAGERPSGPLRVPKMCTAGQRVSLTITGPGPSFLHV